MFAEIIMGTVDYKSLIANELPKNIRIRRNERLMTQDGLAHSLGVPRTTIASIESGRSMPSLHLLLKICEKLECSPNELLPKPETQVEGNSKIFVKLAKDSLKPQNVIAGQKFLEELKGVIVQMKNQ